MPNKQGPGYIEEMMRMAASGPQGGGGMPPQGMDPNMGPPPGGMPPQGPPPQEMPPQGPPPQGGGEVQPGPLGPDQMVPGALMIVEVQGMFFLVPSVDEQGQQMDEARAVQHLQETGLFYAASQNPQALVDFAEAALTGGQGMPPQEMPPQGPPPQEMPPQGPPPGGGMPPR